MPCARIRRWHLMLLLQQVEGTSGRDLGPPPTPDRLEKRPQPFGRPRTWIRLTPRGRQAYLGHVHALRNLTGYSRKEN